MSPDESTPGEQPTATTRPEPDPTIEIDASATELLPTLEDLLDLAEKTVSLPRMSFELDVALTLPGSTSAIIARRTGSFDDETFSGVGTRSFEGEERAIAELFGEEPFEVRFVGETLWMYNPLGDPPAWGGFDVFELAEFAGGDPLASVDGDAYLGLVVSVAIEVVDVQQQADGGALWVLLVPADDLVPVVAAAGPAARLVELGAAQSDLTAELRLEVGSDGYLSGFTADLDEWWTNAVSLLDGGGGATGETMRVEFRLEPFDEPIGVEAPCPDPSTTLEAEGLTVLTCGP